MAIPEMTSVMPMPSASANRAIQRSVKKRVKSIRPASMRNRHAALGEAQAGGDQIAGGNIHEAADRPDLDHPEGVVDLARIESELGHRDRGGDRGVLEERD